MIRATIYDPTGEVETHTAFYEALPAVGHLIDVGRLDAPLFLLVESVRWKHFPGAADGAASIATGFYPFLYVRRP